MKSRRTSVETPVTNYHVIDAADIEDLSKKVEAYLAAGWKLQGGVCFSQWRFYQAMTK